jgi:UDP-galactopyranose mutase
LRRVKPLVGRVGDVKVTKGSARGPLWRNFEITELLLKHFPQSRRNKKVPIKYDYLVVGAGFFGSVIAERIANVLGRTVLVIDKRPHVGGNCYSTLDEETQIEFHQYGTHIFHTSSKKAWSYITRFTEFNNYHHQVLTTHQEKVFQMPINLETINSFYGLNLRPAEARALISGEIAEAGISVPKNLEEKAISLIGRPLYEAFIKGYTIKQWDKEPIYLPAKIISRLPVRYNYREDYFLSDRWQGIPLEGYTAVFERLLDSRNIDIQLNCDFFENRVLLKPKIRTIFTGPIDQYFNYCFGRLEWRTVEFEKQVLELEDYQGTAVMNYADSSTPFTRTHEPKHLHPERRYTNQKTVVFHETSRRGSEEPYYPVNTLENTSLYERYREVAVEEKDVTIAGRLGSYAYYDMDKTILAALKCFETEIVV